MSILRVGSTGKYADNWDTIFGGKKRRKPATTAKKKAAPKKTAKKAKRK